MAQMVRQGRGGAVVNISSTVGLRGCPGFVAYTAAKAGVLGLTRAAAADGAPYNIRVNAIAPGVTLTPANPRFLEVPRDSAAFREREQELPHLLKRIAEPEEIVNVAAFLCSDQASFITGATVPVDGGWTAAV
jgi:NAD(P)-dependent dehydrogenase (short-subunit alcohol dehydrogenase family)